MIMGLVPSIKYFFELKNEFSFFRYKVAIREKEEVETGL